MMKHIRITLASLLAAVLLAGCASGGGSGLSQLAPIVGAIGGGLLGSQVGSGSGKTFATIGGTVAGGVLGQEVATYTATPQTTYYQPNCQEVMAGTSRGATYLANCREVRNGVVVDPRTGRVVENLDGRRRQGLIGGILDGFRYSGDTVSVYGNQVRVRGGGGDTVTIPLR